MQPLRRLAAVLIVTASTSAQTYVVDASGTGQFTSIAAAVAAVPDGSTLQVRAGYYVPFVVTGKSLKILCELGTLVFQQTGSWVGVSGLAAGQSVVIEGLTLSAGWGFPRQVHCSSCAGTVLIDNIGADNANIGTITATDCAQVLVRGRSLAVNWRTCTLTNSNVVLETVSLAPGLIGLALTMTGGTLQAVGCAIQGGIPYSTSPGGAMALAQGASVRLLAGTTLVGFPTATSPAIYGDGTVHHDPSIALPAVPFGPTIVAVAEAMPALTSGYAASAATASLAGALGHFGVICVGLPGPVLTVPGIDGALWVHAASLFPVAFGPVDTGAPLQAQLPWTPGPVPGVRALWQALTFAPTGTLHLSNPSLTLLP